MKRSLKYITMIAAAVLALTGEAFAQHNVYKGELGFGTPKMTLQGETLIIDIEVDLSKLTLHKQQLMVLTPMLRMREGQANNTYIFAPVAINGKVRHKALQRSMKFDHVYFEYEPGVVVKRTNGKSQVLPISLSVPFEGWMNSAELVFMEEVTGCANCHVAYNEYIISGQPAAMTPAPAQPAPAPAPEPTPVVPVPVPVYQEPNFVLSLIVPDIEDVKHRSETYSSSLNFVVGRHDIIRNYKSNRERLDMIDRIINNVKNDRNLTLTELRVTGYASPEGGFDNNMALSKRRALSFVNYLKQTHGLADYMVQFYWRGEDWQGLRDRIAKSELPERNEVVHIIDSYPNLNQRKAKLREINYGETYQYLLGVYYPSLRRDEYTISYIAKNFDPAEARAVIRTKPQQLSLNEMFLVAGTYPVGSPEFKEVFVIAARHFPDDPTANTNVGAIEIENGDVDGAIRRLTGIETPEAWNNLGIAYIKKGEYRLAEEFFRRATLAGDNTAQSNLQQLQSWSYGR